jgi:hypothetical protein
MMPHGPQQEKRDNAMRARHAEGRGVFTTGAPAEQWEEIKELFGYEAEDPGRRLVDQMGLAPRASQRAIQRDGGTDERTLLRVREGVANLMRGHRGRGVLFVFFCLFCLSSIWLADPISLFIDL